MTNRRTRRGADADSTGLLAAQIEHSNDVIEELPDADDRAYETDADQRLDETLTDAIEAAETVSNDMLVCVLRFELAGHHLKHGDREPMTAHEPETETEDGRRGAGQCDICDEPIDLDKHDAEAIGIDREGEYEVTPEEAIEAVASSLELSSASADQKLAEALREKNRYCVHKPCFERTGLADEEVWG